MEDGPQAARLGELASQILQAWLEDDGVSLRLGAEVEAIEGGRVRLAGEASAEGDLILVAGGVEPEVGIAAEAGLALEAGRIQVDERMRSSIASVLAAGDVAFAFNAAAGRHLAVEHWGEALAMGRVAGQTAAGAEASWAEVPGSGPPSVIGRSSTPPGETVSTMPPSWITVVERSPSGTRRRV